MALFILSLIAVFVSAFYIFLISGWQAAYSRKCLIQAVELVRQREFAGARNLVLVAAKQNPALKSNPDVQALYEMIIAKPADDSADEIERFVKVITQLPKTKGEKFVGNSNMQVVLIVVVFILVLLRLFSRS